MSATSATVARGGGSGVGGVGDSAPRATSPVRSTRAASPERSPPAHISAAAAAEAAAAEASIAAAVLPLVAGRTVTAAWLVTVLTGPQARVLDVSVAALRRLAADFSSSERVYAPGCLRALIALGLRLSGGPGGAGERRERDAAAAAAAAAASATAEGDGSARRAGAGGGGGGGSSSSGAAPRADAAGDVMTIFTLLRPLTMGLSGPDELPVPPTAGKGSPGSPGSPGSGASGGAGAMAGVVPGSPAAAALAAAADARKELCVELGALTFIAAALSGLGLRNKRLASMACGLLTNLMMSNNARKDAMARERGLACALRDVFVAHQQLDVARIVVASLAMLPERARRVEKLIGGREALEVVLGYEEAKKPLASI